ncbi:unnamed protein product [Staurois parvus]|uniref:Uncharacterized protein n=1 Tax=Staurois parvus TaxID=386267 RepID=A0ABN9BZ74_9NEOB|nr:unnamed protein product [Staurois parvus]
MQLPVLGCTFLTLSEREESTAENRQLSEQGSAPIIRALMISALMISAQQCHLCQQCHPPVPTSAAQQWCQSVPSSCANQCILSVTPH